MYKVGSKVDDSIDGDHKVFNQTNSHIRVFRLGYNECLTHRIKTVNQTDFIGPPKHSWRDYRITTPLREPEHNSQ